MPRHKQWAIDIDTRPTGGTLMRYETYDYWPAAKQAFADIVKPEGVTTVWLARVGPGPNDCVTLDCK